MKFSRRRGIHRYLLIACSFLLTVPAFAGNQAKGPRVIHELKHDVSAPLSEMARNAGPVRRQRFQEKPERRPPAGYFQQISGIDPVNQEDVLANAPMTK